MRQTHIKSKALAIALSFLMALTMMPCWAIMTADEASADDYKIQILNDQNQEVEKCEKLSDAIIKANEGYTVKLLDDVEEAVTVDKSITLDLNGKKLSHNGDSDASQNIESQVIKVTSGNFTLIDSDVSQKGRVVQQGRSVNQTIKALERLYEGVRIIGNATFNFSSGTIDAPVGIRVDGSGILNMIQSAKINYTGPVNSQGYRVVGIYAATNNTNPQINVNGGEISISASQSTGAFPPFVAGIYMGDNVNTTGDVVSPCQMNLKNTTVKLGYSCTNGNTNVFGVYTPCNETVIDECKINVSSQNEKICAGIAATGTSTISNCDVIAQGNASYGILSYEWINGSVQHIGNVVVSSGKYKGASAGLTGTTNGKASVSGGYYSSIGTWAIKNGYERVEDSEFEGYLYKVQAKTSGNVCKIGENSYTTLEAAINAACDGATITMIDNCDENIVIPSSKNINLDGGNYTMTGGFNVEGKLNILKGTFKSDPSDYVIETKYVENNSGNFTIKEGAIISVNGRGFNAYDKAFVYANSLESSVDNPVIVKALKTEPVPYRGEVIDIGSIQTYNTSITVDAGKYVVFDLNGKAVKANDAGTITVKGNLTLRDSSSNTPGVFVSAANHPFEISATGTLNVDNGKYFNDNCGDMLDPSTCSIIENLGTVNIKDGYFCCVKGKTAFQDDLCEQSAFSGTGTFNITGGYFGTQTSITPIEGYKVEESTNPPYYKEYTGTTNTKNQYAICIKHVVSDKIFVAQIGTTKYETLTDAAATAKSGDTIELLANIEDTGTVTLKQGVSLDGKSNKISGNSNISLAAAGGQTVENVTFENIHNDLNKLSPIYGNALAGAATITGCTFNGWDWDAIQITPVKDAEITITGNTFTANTGGNKSNRAVHIESLQNVDFGATVTGNKFINVANLSNTGLEIYYPAKASKLDCSGNYIDAPMGVCIGVGTSYNNAYAKAFPLKDSTLTNDVDIQAIINKGGNIFLYPTFTEALAAVENGETIELVADITDAIGISIGDTVHATNFTIDFAGHKYVVDNPGAGSTGTETNAFQLLAGKTITFKNGTIECSPENLEPATGGAKNIKRIFQSYANLTLDDMKIDGTKVYGNNAVAEFANGNVNIVGNTSIIAHEGADAFNVDTWTDDYPNGAHVTVDTTGKIGSIKLTYDNDSPANTKSSLVVDNGKIASVGFGDNADGKVDVNLNSGVYTTAPTVGIPEGMAVIANPDEETKTAYPYTIGIDDPEENYCVITTTSKMVDSSGEDTETGHIALLEGGGQYEKGDSVTLKASPVDNFEFLGWFKGDNTEPETTNMVLEFDASEDANYVAKYQAPAANAKVTAEVVSKKTSPGAEGATGTVTIKDVSGTTAEVAVGTKVTLTATPTGDHSYFIAWQNPNGAILSTDNTFTTTVLQSKTVQAVFANEGAALVNYKDEANQSLSSKLYFASEALEAAEAVAPSKKGQEFKKWVDSKGEPMDDEAVKKAIQQSAKATSVGVVTLIAKYDEVGEYTITVYSILEDGTVLGDPKTFTNNLGTPSEITAAEKSDLETYNFQGFKTSADGQIVSTARQFTVNPEGNIELWIVYSEQNVATPTPAITLDSPFDASTNVNKIGYTMSWNLPEEYTLVEAGFCYGTTENEIKGTEPRKSVSDLTGKTGSFTMNVYVHGNEDKNLYVYAYIKYKQGGGEPQTLRIGTVGTTNATDVENYLTTTFNSLNNNTQQ